MGEDQALVRLREILARPEYQVDQTPPWWEQLLAPVFELIEYAIARLIQTVVDTHQLAARAGSVLACWRSAWCCSSSSARIWFAWSDSPSSATRGSAMATLAERRERSERLWQTAHQLAAAGQLADAVRVLYLSALYALDERALLHVETSLTNREHARQLSRTHPALGETFSAVVERYDRAALRPVSGDRRPRLTISAVWSRRARTASLQGSTT